MAPPKTLVFCLFAVLLISILFYYAPDADALTKGSGSKRPTTEGFGSHQVCGDQLCFKITKSGIFDHSRFAAGGVAQQAIDVGATTVPLYRIFYSQEYYDSTNPTERASNVFATYKSPPPTSKILGYVFTTQVQGTVPLYRIFYSQEYYDSTNPTERASNVFATYKSPQIGRASCRERV